MSKKTVFIARFLSALFRTALRAPGSGQRARRRGVQINCGTPPVAAKDTPPHDFAPAPRSAEVRLTARKASPAATRLPRATILRDTKGTRSNARARRRHDNEKPVSTPAECACL